jgi:hypothetical protein
MVLQVNFSIRFCRKISPYTVVSQDDFTRWFCRKIHSSHSWGGGGQEAEIACLVLDAVTTVKLSQQQQSMELFRFLGTTLMSGCNGMFDLCVIEIIKNPPVTTMSRAQVCLH